MATRETVISPKAELRASEIEGKGMFAKEPIKAGELVVQWGGEFVNEKEADEARKQGRLVMQWDDDLFSIEDRGESDDYFINHSCDCNLWMEGPYSLIARRDIAQSEELTADYALWEADPNYLSAWICKCGSKDCRGRVRGTDWRQSDVRKKYAGHFSPLINKRIDEL